LSRYGVRLLGRQRPPSTLPSRLKNTDMSPWLCLQYGHVLPGAIRLVNAGHAAGIPVLVGGRAFKYGTEHALRVGADGWAADVDAAVEILGSWRRQKPSFSAVPILPGRATTELRHRSNELSTTVLDDLLDVYQYCRVLAPSARAGREYLSYVVRYVAAAQMVDDDVS